MSVSPPFPIEQLGSHCNDFHEISYLNIFRKSVENIQFHKNMTKVTGTSHEEKYTFFIISPSILRMRNVSDESCVENQNTCYVR
jgi:hypothetical protein